MAKLYNPFGIAVTPDGATVYVSESFADRIRQIDVASGSVTTLAGAYNLASFADGVGTNARFNVQKHVAACCTLRIRQAAVCARST